MMKKIFTCLVLLFAVMANVNATVIWEGNVSYANGRALPEASNRVTIDANQFAKAKVGDFIFVDFTNYAADPGTNHVMRLCVPQVYTEMRRVLISEGDRGATVCIDKDMLTNLQQTGLVLSGSGFTATSVSLNAPHDNLIWEGQKVVVGGGWTVGIVTADLFANVAVGNQLVITAKKTGEDATCVLESRGDKWPALSADEGYSNTFTSFNETGETTFTFPLNADAAQALKENGLIVDGNAYTLLSVALKTTATSIRNTEVSSPACKGVYTLSGAKVSDKAEGSRLPQGLYIVNGKRIVIR